MNAALNTVVENLKPKTLFHQQFALILLLLSARHFLHQIEASLPIEDNLQVVPYISSEV